MSGPRKIRPLGAIGFAAFVAGLLAWVWLGEWRWALTGFGVTLVCLAFDQGGGEGDAD